MSTIDRNHRVFINCPWLFRDRWEGLLLALAATGFHPLGELDIRDPSHTDISKVARSLSESRYSIHDCSLSSCPKGKVADRGRFNLPIELGMAVAEREKTGDHELLVLLPSGHAYFGFMYNLTQVVPGSFRSEDDLVKTTVEWLSSRATCNVRPHPERIVQLRSALKESAGNVNRIEEIYPKACKIYRERAHTFDVFLSYNSKDREVIQAIITRLQACRIDVWFDDTEILGGQLFREGIERDLPRCRCIAVFLGPQGLGKYQQLEIDLAIDHLAKERKVVIPVLLPGLAENTNSIPGMLSGFSRIIFSHKDDEEAIGRLIRAITQQML